MAKKLKIEDDLIIDDTGEDISQKVGEQARQPQDWEQADKTTIAYIIPALQEYIAVYKKQFQKFLC